MAKKKPAKKAAKRSSARAKTAATPKKRKAKPKVSAPLTRKAARVRVETRALADLTPAPYNPRRIDKDALRGLSASLERFGVLEPIVINERTGHVVGGHQRIKALEQQGIEETDVVVVDLSETDERAANVALNNPHTMGEWSDDLPALLERLREDLPLEDFMGLRFDLLDDRQEELSEGDGGEAPEEGSEVCRPGDLITLGGHRLICGDSTDALVVARVLGDAKPGLMVTDPPYGVEYDPEWRAKVNDDGPESRRAVGKVANDDRADWREAYALFGGDVAYVWHASWYIPIVEDGLRECSFELRSLIIWGKQRHSFGRGHYHWQHEPCWYGVRKSKTAKWCGDRKQSTLWSIDNNRNNETGHGTQKPIECMARPMRNHDFPEVYDPFLGSGTTLIAAEQLGRTCYGVELSPGYCDVIVKRYLSVVERQDVTIERDGETLTWEEAQSAQG